MGLEPDEGGVHRIERELPFTSLVMRRAGVKKISFSSS